MRPRAARVALWSRGVAYRAMRLHAALVESVGPLGTPVNSDRCQHVETSPGQTMCTCRDYAMWLRFVITVQAGYITDLERRMHTVPPRIITVAT